MPKKHKEPEHCHEPNYDSELEQIVILLKAGLKAGVHELHLLRKSVEHIEEIFDRQGQIGKPIITFGKPQDKG